MHKTIILDWVDSNPDFCGYHPAPDASCITEVSKTTTKAGLTIHKYEIAGRFAHYDDLYVLENADGTFSVLKDHPDHVWSFLVWEEDDERVIYFSCPDIEADTHVSFLLEDRLPTDADEVIESGFMFSDDIDTDDLIEMLQDAGFIYDDE